MEKNLLDHRIAYRLSYSLKGWDDIATMILSREKSLRDYIYSYWSRLSEHLEKAPDAVSF